MDPFPLPLCAVFVVVFQHAFMNCTYLPLPPTPFPLILDSVAYIHGFVFALPFDSRKYQIEHGCL
jgi:hypothetical protein